MDAVEYIKMRERFLDNDEDYWADYKFHLKEINRPEEAVSFIEDWSRNYREGE